MNVLSTTIDYEGSVIKIENGRVFTRAFGTTYYNQKMHWSWVEIKPKEGGKLQRHLKSNKLL